MSSIVPPIREIKSSQRDPKGCRFEQSNDSNPDKLSDSSAI